MSDSGEWGRRRKRSLWINFFEEFNRIEAMMDEMMRRAFEVPLKEAKMMRPYVYGFSVSIGPDGKPVAQEFGNIQPSRLEPRLREEREPLVDIFREKDEIAIVADLPGVEKEDIKLYATEKALTISVGTPQRRYFKELELPEIVDPTSGKATYKNGVLEVRLKKTKLMKIKGENVQVR